MKTTPLQYSIDIDMTKYGCHQKYQFTARSRVESLATNFDTAATELDGTIDIGILSMMAPSEDDFPLTSWRREAVLAAQEAVRLASGAALQPCFPEEGPQGVSGFAAVWQTPFSSHMQRARARDGNNVVGGVSLIRLPVSCSPGILRSLPAA